MFQPSQSALLVNGAVHQKTWGGPSGYQEFPDVILEPGHEEFEHYRAWAGDAVHAEEFDVVAVNKILDRMRWPRRHRR